MYVSVCHTNDDVWLAHRTTGIGASEMPAVLGESPWASALSVYADKVDGHKEIEGNEAIEWGHRLEPVVLEAYAERTMRKARRSGMLLRSTEHPWALATLDGWTGDAHEEWPLEIKTAGAQMTEAWEEGAPRIYQIQVQHQMLVTGAKRATIACLIGGQKLVWCDVERDEVEIRRIIHAGSELWTRIQERRPPEPDGTEASDRALKRLYRQDDGSAVDLGAELAEVLDELEEAKRDEKEIVARKTKLEQRLKAAMGNAQIAHAGRWIATWKTQPRAGYVVEPGETRVLRIKAQKQEKAA